MFSIVVVVFSSFFFSSLFFLLFSQKVDEIRIETLNVQFCFKKAHLFCVILKKQNKSVSLVTIIGIELQNRDRTPEQVKCSNSLDACGHGLFDVRVTRVFFFCFLFFACAGEKSSFGQY